MNRYDASGQLDSDLLRSFLAVVRSGGITAAARDLHRTQSAVSVHIKRLRAALGVAQFEREARRVTLTPAGQRLLGDAGRILAMLDRVFRSFRTEPVTGLVAAGIPDEYGGTLPSM